MRPASMFERALGIARKSLPAGHTEMGALLVNIGRYERLRGRPGRSADRLEEALQILERTLGADHIRTVAAVTALGELYVAQGRYESAEAMYRRALAAAGKEPGARSRSGGHDRQPGRRFAVRAAALRRPTALPARLADLEIAPARRKHYAKKLRELAATSIAPTAVRMMPAKPRRVRARSDDHAECISPAHEPIRRIVFRVPDQEENI